MRAISIVTPFAFLVQLTSCVQGTSEDEPILSDYCQNEKFAPSCPPGHVIVITKAFHGRMREGRCIERNYGYISCADDVIAFADLMCSGRDRCEIQVPNANFSAYRGCPNDLKSYFAVAYDCVSVITRANVSRGCLRTQRTSPIRLTSPKGILASHVAQTTGMGSPECPWLIQAPPGKRINITLYDFSTMQSSDLSSAYAVLKESTSTTLYSQINRVRVVYVSTSNKVEVRMMTPREETTSKHFLLAYEMIGCADLQLPLHVEWQRLGDSATVTCGGRQWHLTCRNDVWEGEFNNCSTPGDASRVLEGGGQFPFTGASLIVILAIAAALGAVILVTGLVFIKCRRQTGYPDASSPNVYQPAAPKDLPNSPFMYPHSHRAEADAMYQSSENEYAYISDFPPLGTSMEGHEGKKCVDYGTASSGPRSGGGKVVAPSSEQKHQKHTRRSLNAAKIPHYVDDRRHNATLPRDTHAYFVLDPGNSKKEIPSSGTCAGAVTQLACVAADPGAQQSMGPAQRACGHVTPSQVRRTGAGLECAPVHEPQVHHSPGAGSCSSSGGQFSGDTLPNGTVMRRMNQSIHEFTSCACDHLVDSPENTNHKSV